jgi:antitoxin (DNA-binding transcriptional repressor) of toxin-antitoxin stability system
MSTSQPVHSVSLEQAQADLSGLIARLPTQGEIVITNGSRPIARLVAAPATGERKLGTMAGSVLYMAPDFDAPLEDFREYT